MKRKDFRGPKPAGKVSGCEAKIKKVSKIRNYRDR